MQTQDKEPRLAGVDLLRLLAAALVFLTHALALCDLTHWSAPLGFSFGRLGTTLFFVLGGYLAATTRRQPNDWLGYRLRHLFPAYWVMLTVAFLAAGVTQYKPFDAWQVICQFAGVGYFTHGGQLVNVTTWFVSVILAIYLIVYLAKRTRQWPVVTVALVAIPLVGAWISPATFSNLCAASMFLVAYSISLAGASNGASGRSLTAVWLVALGLGSFVLPDLRSAFLALLLLATVGGWRRSWGTGRRLASYSYEWFLVHGLALHLVVRIIGPELWAVIPLAAGVSMVSALALHRIAAVVDRHTLAKLLPTASERAETSTVCAANQHTESPA